MEKRCLQCGALFRTTHIKQICCSVECSNLFKKGKHQGEHRSPNTEFKKGLAPWNKGIPRTKEEKDLISKLSKQRIIDNPEILEKQSVAMKKYYKNGGKHPMLGRKHTEEAKKLMSISKIGKQSKENHPNWKGGITPENDLIRKSKKYIFWRSSCLERDNFTCQISGQYGGKLVVHHINNFADFPELRFAIDNGITMTKELHKEFHKKYGRHNNTREQLEEFSNQLKIK